MKNTDNGVKAYGQRLTTTIVFIWALTILALGFAMVIVGIVALFDERTAGFLMVAPILVILIGFGVIVIGSLVYVIGALSKDVYNILFYNEYMTNENENFHTSSPSSLRGNFSSAMREYVFVSPDGTFS